MPQRNAKETPAARRANEALDRVAGGDKTPVKKALAFLLEGSHDEPVAEVAQSQPNPSPNPAQPEDSPKIVQTQSKPSPIAPERNFNKRANSLEHSALPSGLFPGASKKIYDALYVRTRGAVVPARTVQARHRELMSWSGVKDIKTVKTHLNKLRDMGLVAWQTLKGEHEGSFYEVFLPEEANLDLAQTQPNPSPAQKLDWDLAQNLGWAGLGNPHDSKELNPPDKTSFKTIEKSFDDDEAFAEFLAALKQASREVTGRESSPSDAARWGELAEVLVTELKIAAGRTTVSSVPAFLAEHLRRRLWKKEKRQLDAERSKEQPGPAHRVDAAQCPDCFGTGMWYPEGFDKGVARCEHKSLAKPDAQLPTEADVQGEG
ncbi:MAG TPA: hypothetical protein VGX48_25650 [Pyrinomonadaceae bacterium]|jgi:hypothetical protein|nr:hypothetical protein [Pyrinomonadaceae bacterium]